MTDDQIHDAIAGDSQAKALADAGNDAGCAARLAVVLPPAVGTAYVTERKLFDVLGDLDAALAFLGALRAIAAGQPMASPPVPGNPAVARVLEWLSPSEGGVDAGNPLVRGMLDQFAAAGVVSSASVAKLKGLAETPAAVDFNQVSRAWLRYRPDGEVL